MSDSENVNATPASTPNPMVSQPTKTTTADDLLEMYDEIEQEAVDDVSKEADKQAKVQEEVPKKIAANQIKKRLDESNKETKSLSDSGEDVQKEGEEVKTPSQRSVKAKLGEDELDIPEEAEIPLTINGKEATFKVKDIIKEFGSLETRKRQVDQKLSWADRREKGFQEQMTTLKGQFQQIAERAAKGDYFASIRFMADLAGKDVADYEKEFLQNVDKISTTYAKMNAQEREAFHSSRKAEFLQEKLSKTEEKISYEEGIKKIQGRIVDLCKEHGLTEDRYLQRYQELVNTGVKAEGDIQPEDVIVYDDNMAYFTKVGEAISSVDPKLSEDGDFFQWVAEFSWAEKDNWSVEDIAQIVKDAVGKADPKTVENLNRKVRQSGINPRAKSNQVISKNEDEEDELYDHFFHKRPVITRR